MAKGLVRFGRVLVLTIEAIIIVSVSVLIGLTTHFLCRDIVKVYVLGSTAELQLIMNDIFLLIVYVELVRSIVVAYRRLEMCLISIAEVSFITTVKDVLTSVLSEQLQTSYYHQQLA